MINFLQFIVNLGTVIYRIVEPHIVFRIVEPHVLFRIVEPHLLF